MLIGWVFSGEAPSLFSQTKKSGLSFESFHLTIVPVTAKGRRQKRKRLLNLY